MSRKDTNIFSKIYDTIGAFNNLGLLEEIDALTGNFSIRRKTNRRGISNVKATFTFTDDIVNNLGFKKVKFKDRVTNSLFGDAQNPRKVRSGNKKLDYFDGSQKLVELSVERKFLNKFEKGKRFKGFFRASLDDNFIAMSKGQSDQFSNKKILTADFELPFIETIEIGTGAISIGLN
ncbi:hypothetical protein OAZ24_04205 [Synechococcus sp. AH-736-G21]|nr:hypothetical protein [Synechococcus sp. AH-736-G21]